MKEKSFSKNALWYGGLFLVISIISMFIGRLLPFRISLMKGGIIETLLISGGIFILQKNNFEDIKLNWGKFIGSSIVATIIFYILESVVVSISKFIYSKLPYSLMIYIITNILVALITYCIWTFIYITLCKFIFKIDNPYTNLKKNILISLIILVIFSIIAGIINSASQFLAFQMLQSGKGIHSLLGFMEMSARWDLTYPILFVKSVIMAILSVGLVKQDNAN